MKNDCAKFTKSANKHNSENIHDWRQLIQWWKKIARNLVLIFLGRPLRGNDVKVLPRTTRLTPVSLSISLHHVFYMVQPKTFCQHCAKWMSCHLSLLLIFSVFSFVLARREPRTKIEVQCGTIVNVHANCGTYLWSGQKNTPPVFSIPRWKHTCKLLVLN